MAQRTPALKAGKLIHFFILSFKWVLEPAVITARPFLTLISNEKAKVSPFNIIIADDETNNVQLIKDCFIKKQLRYRYEADDENLVLRHFKWKLFMSQGFEKILNILAACPDEE